jgi:hypothetical protein
VRADTGVRRPLSLAVCLLTPLVVLLLGVVASLAIVMKATPDLKQETGRGQVPPGFSVELPGEGDYTVWWVKTDSAAKFPSGARVVIFDSEHGTPIDLNSLFNASTEYGGESQTSVGSLKVTRATTIDIKASGVSDPITLAIAPAKAAKMLSVALSIGVVMVITVLAAIIVLFVLLHRRRAVIDDSAGVHSHAPAGLPAEDD